MPCCALSHNQVHRQHHTPLASRFCTCEFFTLTRRNHPQESCGTNTHIPLSQAASPHLCPTIAVPLRRPFDASITSAVWRCQTSGFNSCRRHVGVSLYGSTRALTKFSKAGLHTVPGNSYCPRISSSPCRPHPPHPRTCSRPRPCSELQERRLKS